MRIGRNFQDSLLVEFLSEPERAALPLDVTAVARARAAFGEAARTDVARQARVAADMDLHHLEIEQRSPHWFARKDFSELFAARETARIFGVTLSVHLAGAARDAWRWEGLTEDAQKEIEALKVLGCESVVLAFDAFRDEKAGAAEVLEGGKALAPLAARAFERGLNVFLEVPGHTVLPLDEIREAVETLAAPARVALRLSEPAALYEKRVSVLSKVPAGYFQYVRLAPGPSGDAGGLPLSDPGAGWPPESVPRVMQQLFVKAPDLVVVSGAPQSARDYLAPRRLLADEAHIFREALRQKEGTARLSL